MNYVIMFYLMRVLFSYSPIETEPIKLTSYEYTPIKIERVLSVEEQAIEKALQYLAYRESRNGYHKISYTQDYGKYQINISNLYNHNINPNSFLKDYNQQEMFARKFMKIHIDILKNPRYNIYHNEPITPELLVNSWSGIGVVLNRKDAYERVFLPTSYDKGDKPINLQ